MGFAPIVLRSPISGSAIRSERGGQMAPPSIVVWFARACDALGLDGRSKGACGVVGFEGERHKPSYCSPDPFGCPTFTYVQLSR
jgi:hypothetical protein